MHNHLNIPATIKVGFQSRGGTYTGKLAYVTYFDQKGILRKQKSWENWRDQKIPALELENEPLSGFVLNKKVGENRWGWNPRKAWVRVYDPRDFEFEISVANLLFILEETSSIKGKGLEGDFVYAWGGTELVLLPTSSLEYKESVQFTSLQVKKITKKDMVEGCIYRTKDNNDYMYLGRHVFYTPDYGRDSNGNFGFQYSGEKQHVFVSIDGKSTYWTQRGFTKLALRLTEESSPQFAEEYDRFMKSVHANKPARLVMQSLSSEKLEATLLQKWHRLKCFVGIGSDIYSCILERAYPRDQPGDWWTVITAPSPVRVSDGRVTIPRPGSYGWRRRAEDVVSDEQLRSKRFLRLFLENEHGNMVQVD